MQVTELLSVGPWVHGFLVLETKCSQRCHVTSMVVVSAELALNTKHFPLRMTDDDMRGISSKMNSELSPVDQLS